LFCGVWFAALRLLDIGEHILNLLGWIKGGTLVEGCSWVDVCSRDLQLGIAERRILLEGDWGRAPKGMISENEHRM
jgi:hypothetical protein